MGLWIVPRWTRISGKCAVALLSVSSVSVPENARTVSRGRDEYVIVRVPQPPRASIRGFATPRAILETNQARAKIEIPGNGRILRCRFSLSIDSFVILIAVCCSSIWDGRRFSRIANLCLLGFRLIFNCDKILPWFSPKIDYYISLSMQILFCCIIFANLHINFFVKACCVHWKTGRKYLFSANGNWSGQEDYSKIGRLFGINKQKGSLLRRKVEMSYDCGENRRTELIQPNKRRIGIIH